MNKKYPPEFYEEQVHSLTNLPTLPAIATEILQIVRQDKFSAFQLCPLIEKDPPLAMKVLKMANSSYYGFRDKVESLGRAIVIIGMKELSQLVMGFSVIKAFGTSNKDTLRWKKFWEHSAACGHVAELLNIQLSTSIPSSCYTLGLLHDVGKLTLHKIDPKNFYEALEIAHLEGCDLLEAEKNIIGVTHAQVGKWITKKWQLPEAIIYAAGYHHHPNDVQDEKYRVSTALIQLSDIITNLRLFNFGTEFLKTVPLEVEGWSIINETFPSISGMDFEYFVMKLEEELETIHGLASMLEN